MKFCCQIIIQYGPTLAPGTNLRGARKTNRTLSTIDKNEPESSPRSNQFFVKNRPKIISESILERLGGLEAYFCSLEPSGSLPRNVLERLESALEGS